MSAEMKRAEANRGSRGSLTRAARPVRPAPGTCARCSAPLARSSFVVLGLEDGRVSVWRLACSSRCAKLEHELLNNLSGGEEKIVQVTSAELRADSARALERVRWHKGYREALLQDLGPAT